MSHADAENPYFFSFCPKWDAPHCTSGKDRTGVVVAALLTIVGIDRSMIIEEYLLSDGEVHCEWIETALNGMVNPEAYFNRVELQAVVDRLTK